MSNKQPPSPHISKPTGVGKTILFSLTTISLFFVILELVLFLFGVRPITIAEDPLVGFSGSTPLFVEKISDQGSVIMKTADSKIDWFNRQAFPKVKAKNSYRIFCVGGSTTVGRPYRHGTSFCGWLEVFLKRSDPSRNWEVINAGGVSYASYRVARVMTELTQYQPDLFIVYSGQNEFLEHRSYSKLKSLPYWLIYSDSVLRKTRTYAAITEILNSISGNSRANKKSFEMSDEVDEILTHTMGPTSYNRDDKSKNEIIEHYRLNTIRMVEIARQADSKIVFVNPVSNMKDMSPFKSEHKSGLTDSLLQDWNYLFQNASQNLQQGNYEVALKELQKARQIDERYAELHYKIGQAQFHLADYDLAEESFWRAINEDVAPLRILSQMRDVVAEVADRQNAPLVDFQDVLKRAYASEYEHSVFGSEYFLDHVHPTIKGYRLLGHELFDKLVDMKISMPTVSIDEELITKQVLAGVDKDQQRRALMKLGRVFDWAGKFEEAFSLFQKSIELFGADAFAYNMMAKTSYRVGKNDEAIRYFKQALRLDPNVAKAHSFLGNVLLEEGQIEEAEKHYRSALRLNTDEIQVYVSLAMIVSSRKQYTEAINLFDIALQKTPGNDHVIFNYAVMLSKSGKYAESIVQAKKLIEKDVSPAEAHNIIGIAYAKTKKFDQAFIHFNKALEIKPGFKAAKDNILSLKTQRNFQHDNTMKDF